MIQRYTFEHLANVPQITTTTDGEWVRYADIKHLLQPEGVRAVDRDALWQTFRIIDRLGNGYLGREQFESLLDELGIKHSRDMNKDGR